MNAIEKMHARKRGRPATGKGIPIQVRLQPDQLAALDTWIGKHGQSMSRPDAVRRLIELGRTQQVGVTPSDVVEAAKILHAHAVAADPAIGSWSEFLAVCQQEKFHSAWREMVPDETQADAYDYLESGDRELVERVATVVSAATRPPSL